jgi:hypothetical protein
MSNTETEDTILEKKAGVLSEKPSSSEPFPLIPLVAYSDIALSYMELAKQARLQFQY